MEAAGLLLGIYPSLILAFEQYKKGAKYISNWAQFRRRYEAFIRDMEGQQLFFEGILQDLICGGPDPYLTGSFSKDSFLRNINDATFKGWHDPILKERLKMRLDSRYDWCIHTIQRIYDILEELAKLLDIQALKSSNQTPDWWRYQWTRIIQTLFAERYEDHKVAKTLIEELKQMVELSDRQRSQGAVRTISSFTPFFKRIQENANYLHSVLKSGWNCCCSSSHKAMLQLEWRVDKGHSDFNLLFVLPAYTEEPTETSTIMKYVKQGVRVSVFKHEAKEVSKFSLDPGSSSTSVVGIATQVKNAPATAATPRPRSSSNVVTASKESTRSDSSKQKARFTNKSAFQIRVVDKSSALLNKFRGKKMTPTMMYKKDDPIHQGPKRVRHFTVSESMQVQSRLDEERNVERNSSTEVAISTDPTESHSVEAPAAEDHPVATTIALIPDLCKAITQGANDLHLGYLLDESHSQYEFLTITRSICNPKNVTAKTLNELLEGNPLQFPPEKRAGVASILASSLVQLQRTHWLKDSWTKRDIFFMTNEGKVLFDEPYISQEFVSAKQTTSSSPTASPATTRQLPSFRPKISLECLGIVLIELCFGVPIERWEDKVRLRPLDPSDQPNHEFCLAIAHAWTWEEIRAQDPLFSDPINSCLNFPGIGRIQEGRFDEVIHDMYSLIAKPLYDETTRRWPPRLDLSV